MVAMEDCEFDRVGLPGLMVKKGAAGDGSDGAMAGDALVKDGDDVLIGVGTGVLLDEPDSTEGWFIVGCGPV